MQHHGIPSVLFVVLSFLVCCGYVSEATANSKIANSKKRARLQIKEQVLYLKQAPKKPRSREDITARMWSMCQLSQAHDVLGTNVLKASFFEEIVRYHRSLYPIVLPRASLRQHHDCAAYAQFKAAMFLYRAFLALPITSNQSHEQVRQIRTKFKDFGVVKKALGKVGNYHVPARTLCAMLYIAEGKRQIAESIRDAPIPNIKGLQLRPAMLKAYRRNIDNNFVKPLFTDVIRTLRIARKFGKQHKLQTACAKRIVKTLHKLSPKN